MMNRKSLVVTFSVVLLSVLILASACGPRDTVDRNLVEETGETPKTDEYNFSEEEQTYIQVLRSRGYIAMGGLAREGILEVGEDGTFSGIKYDLASAFADFLGVEMQMSVLHFEDYFKNEGVIPEDLKTDTFLSYTPDVFDEIDVISDFLTIQPWRLKIMDMVALVPSNEMLICRSVDPITNVPGMAGKRIGFVPESSFENTLRNAARQANIDVELIPITFDDNAFVMVENGILDGFLEDSQHLFRHLKNYPTLIAGFPVSDLNQLGWATAKGDEVLVGLIYKFFAYAKDSGFLNQIMLRYISLDLDTYYGLIGFEGGQELYLLGLTTTERAWVDEMQRKGVLKIATVKSEDNYLPLDDGGILGFDYMLAKSFADTLGLTLDVQAFDSIAPFFALNGEFNQDVITDPTISYSPTLFEEVDIYCLPFSITDWRKKLVGFVQMHPEAINLAGRIGEEIENLSDLDGKRVAVLRGSFQEGLMVQTMEEHGVEIELIYIESTELPLEVVATGRADFTLDAAAPLITGLRTFDNLAISPVAVKRITNGWAIQRDDVILASILNKFISRSLNDGSFGAMWTSNHGIDFDEYMSFVSE